MKSIESLDNIKNKNIILRLDLNVPIINGKITDTNRIDKIIPTQSTWPWHMCPEILVPYLRGNSKFISSLIFKYLNLDLLTVSLESYPVFSKINYLVSIKPLLDLFLICTLSGILLRICANLLEKIIKEKKYEVN